MSPRRAERTPGAEEALAWLSTAPRPRGAELEGYVSRTATLTVEIRDGEVELVRAASSWGMGIRVLASGKMGFAFTSLLSPRSLRDALDRAAGAARAAPADSDQGFSEPLPIPPAPPLADSGLLALPREQKVRIALETERAARRADPRIREMERTVYSEQGVRARLWNSRGVTREAESVLASIQASAVAAQGGERQSGWEFQQARSLQDLDPARVGAGAARAALDLLGASPPPTGSVPVLLAPPAACDLLGKLGASFLGESVVRGKSPLAGKLGEEVFSPLVTIADEGLDPAGDEAFPFDGEGVPRRRTPLVEEGRLRSFLFDLYWARRTRGASTGSSRRESWKAPPAPGTSNLRLTPGERTPEDLLAPLTPGLWVRELLGVHTVNPVSGDFSLGASGLWVEGGRAVRAVRGATVSGNLFELFRRVEGVGKDLRWLGSSGSPSLLIHRLSVAGK